MTAKWEFDLSVTSMITDQNWQHENLLSSNCDHFNFREKQKNQNSKNCGELIFSTVNVDLVKGNSEYLCAKD